jgi:hypothetical protein
MWIEFWELGSAFVLGRHVNALGDLSAFRLLATFGGSKNMFSLTSSAVERLTRVHEWSNTIISLINALGVLLALDTTAWLTGIQILVPS